MKHYNPFRWHVVEFAPGSCAVRRRALCGLWWTYSDIDDLKYNWGVGHIKYCLTPSREKAIAVAGFLRSDCTVIWP